MHIHGITRQRTRVWWYIIGGNEEIQRQQATGEESTQSTNAVNNTRSVWSVIFGYAAIIELTSLACSHGCSERGYKTRFIFEKNQRTGPLTLGMLGDTFFHREW